MSITLNGSTYLTRSRGAASYPFTMFAWVKWAAADLNTQTAFGASTAASQNTLFSRKFNAKQLASMGGPGGGASRFSTDDIVTTWQPVMIYFADASSRYIRYSSGAASSDGGFSVSTNPATFDTSFVGALVNNGTVTEYMVGDIAEVTEWAGDRTGDWAALAAGALPETIGSPTFHNSFLDSATLGGYTVAAGSVATGATHPITRSPSSSSLLSKLNHFLRA